MTVRGIICILLDILLFILALGSSIPALLIIAATLAAFWVFSLLSLGLAVLMVGADSTLDRPEVSRGESVNYRFVLRGLVLLPVIGHIIITPPGAEPDDKTLQERHAFWLRPSFRKWEHIFQLELPCAHRGRWSVAPQVIQLRDVFGMFTIPLQKMRRRSFAPAELAVYPRQYTLKQREDANLPTEGFSVALMRNSYNGELFGDTREHQPGDPVRRVHWKQTARAQKLYIRQFEAQENPQVLLLLDLAGRHDSKDTADVSTEIAAALAKHVAGLHKSLQLVPMRPEDGNDRNDSTFWMQDERDFDRLVEVLTDAAFHQEEAPLDAWQLRDARFVSAGCIWVISENPSDGLLEDLESLRQEGRRVTCFVPAPGDPPAEATDAQPAEPGSAPVVINASDEIPEKVGACV